MKRNHRNTIIAVGFAFIGVWGCKTPEGVADVRRNNLPEKYEENLEDTLNTAEVNWADYFDDPNLIALIDTAIAYNQELNILAQEIAISNNEIKARKGEYLPFLNAGAGGELDKVGRYTRYGVLEKSHEIDSGEEFPEPFSDLFLTANASWEIDIWKKLRNAKKSAVLNYLASVEGRNFMKTKLVAEVANSYYELVALDNQLKNIQQNIQIQQKALSMVRLQKKSAKVNELAVKKFEAELFKNKSKQFLIHQKITETENRINYLLGRYPRSIKRLSKPIDSIDPHELITGLPAQLLENRPDVRKAVLEMKAAKIDVKVARANFYPSLGIRAKFGFNAFNAAHLLQTPESMIYSLAGDLVSPLINRAAIKSAYRTANAKQIQAIYNYEQTLLKAFIEVYNQRTNIENLQNSYSLQTKQVEKLTESIVISSDLFKSARADYMEVLMTQRDALEAKNELIETKKNQLNAEINMYQALGGGW
jgi:NodT family efflux transporter outer membrane factor (OMF) lipoprotein